jgi:hypothetical protein
MTIHILQRKDAATIEHIVKKMIDNQQLSSQTYLLTEAQAKIMLKQGQWEKITEKGNVTMQKVVHGLTPAWLQEKPHLSRSERKKNRYFK